MKKVQFKTNINCNSCIRSVTNFINDVKGIESWEVDTENPEKILTVEGDFDTTSLVEAIEDAGFDAKSV